MIKTRLQVKPASLKHHCFKHNWILKKPLEQIWKTLNSMETFSKGQVFPYRVEFTAYEKEASFSSGVWTNHHGPFLNACGQIGDIKAMEYRDLHYNYGSYVLSFRLIRPVRLQFFFKAHPEGTQLSVQFDCYVAPFLYGFWHLLMKIFWSGFGPSIERKK